MRPTESEDVPPRPISRDGVGSKEPEPAVMERYTYNFATPDAPGCGTTAQKYPSVPIAIVGGPASARDQVPAGPLPHVIAPPSMEPVITCSALRSDWTYPTITIPSRASTSNTSLAA